LALEIKIRNSTNTTRKCAVYISVQRKKGRERERERERKREQKFAKTKG